MCGIACGFDESLAVVTGLVLGFGNVFDGVRMLGLVLSLYLLWLGFVCVVLFVVLALLLV